MRVLNCMGQGSRASILARPATGLKVAGTSASIGPSRLRLPHRSPGRNPCAALKAVFSPSLMLGQRRGSVLPG